MIRVVCGHALDRVSGMRQIFLAVVPSPAETFGFDDLPFVGAGGFCMLSIFHDLPSNYSTVDAIVPGEG